ILSVIIVRSRGSESRARYLSWGDSPVPPGPRSRGSESRARYLSWGDSPVPPDPRSRGSESRARAASLGFPFRRSQTPPPYNGRDGAEGEARDAAHAAGRIP